MKLKEFIVIIPDKVEVYQLKHRDCYPVGEKFIEDLFFGKLQDIPKSLKERMVKFINFDCVLATSICIERSEDETAKETNIQPETGNRGI